MNRKHILLTSGKGGSPLEHQFDQGGLSSYSITDPAAPTVRLSPYLDVISGGQNKTQWWAARSRRWSGKTPQIVFAKGDVWFTLTAGMWIGAWATEPDTDDWHKFDNVTIGATDITLNNNSAFSGMTYIALWPMYPFSRTQRLVAEWAADPLVSETASSTNKIIGYSADLTDSRGRSTGALPYYAFKVSSGAGVKNNGILTSRQHACEGIGGWTFEGAIDWLLTSSVERDFLLDYFDFHCYPALYPENIVAGHSRMWWDDFALDINQKWSTTGDSSAVDAFKTAMLADTSGAVEVGLDYHAFGNAGAGLGDLENAAGAMELEFRDQMRVYEPAYGLLQEVLPDSLHHWWTATLGAKLALAAEHGLDNTKTPADWKAHGANTMRALVRMLARGKFTSSPAIGSRTFTSTSKITWPNILTPTPTSPFTVSLWINPTAVNVDQVIWDIDGTTTDGVYVWSNGATGAGRISFAWNRATTALSRQSVNAALATGAWQNVIATYDGSQTAAGVKIYKGGVEVSYASGADGAGTFRAASGLWAFGGDVRFAGYGVRGSGAQNGYWNRVLTAGEIANLAAGYSPALIPDGLVFHFAGNTASLEATPGGTGTQTNTTQATGAGNGPAIIY